MATKTAKLSIVIAGDNKSGVKALDQTGTAADKLGGKFGGLKSGITSALSFGALLGAGKAALSGYEQQAGAIAKIKRLTGESAEDASLLSFAAQQSGIEASKAAAGFVLLAKAAKNGKLAKAGVVTEGENGQLLNFGEILTNLADRYQSLAPGIERTTLATTAFGRGGADLGKILAGGAAGIEDLRAEMESYGLEFSDAGLAKYTKFLKAQRDMQAQFSGLEVQVGSKLIPVVTTFANLMAKIPQPVLAAGVGVGALGATALGLATAVGVLGPPLRAGLASIGTLIPTTGAAAAATGSLAAAVEAEAAAEAIRTDAMLSGISAEAAGVLADEARTASLAASTVATEAAAVASTKVGVSAGGAVAGIGLLAAAAYGLHEAFDGKDGKLTLPGLDELLGGTDEALAEMATGLDSVGDSADNFNQVAAELGTEGLYAMRDAVKATGGKAIPELEKAIKSAEAAEARAAERKKGYAAAADLVTGKTDESAAAIKGEAAALTPLAIALGTVAAAQVQARKETLDRIAKAEKIHDAEKGATDAHEATTEALDAQSVAHRAAIGDSDAYRSAVEGEASAEKDLADTRNSVVEARQAVRDAEADVNKTRAEAVDRINELARAEEDAANKAKDAITGRLDAEAEQRRVNSSGKSTDLDKRKAADAVRDASTEERQSAEEAALAARDATDAKARGVDGDEAVVAARKKVTDANGAVADAEDKVRDAVGKVAASHEAARQVIVDAKAAEKAATDAVRDAQYQEVDAVAALATARQGDVAGIFAKIAALQALGADPVYQQELADAIGAGAPAPVPVSGGFGFGGITVNQTLNGTPRQNAQANARGTRSVLDGIARVFR